MSTEQHRFYISPQNEVYLTYLGKRITGLTAASNKLQLMGWAASEAFSFFTCRPPVRKKAAMVKTVPYMLEEFLIAGVDDYHFTLGAPPQAGEDVPVHVVANTKMQEWQDLLASTHIEPSALYPDLLALPYKKGVITAYLGKKRCLARTEYGKGFCGRGPFFVELLGQQARAEDKQIELITDLRGPLPSSLRAYPLQRINSFMEFLTQAKPPAADLDALHGRYATQQKEISSSYKPLLQMAALLFALILVYQPLALMADYAKVRTQQAQNSELFQQMFDQPLADQEQLRSRALLVMQELADRDTGAIDPIWERVNIVSAILNSCADCTITGFETRRGSRRINLQLAAKQKEPVPRAAFENLGWRILQWRIREEKFTDGRATVHHLDILAEEGR